MTIKLYHCITLVPNQSEKFIRIQFHSTRDKSLLHMKHAELGHFVHWNETVGDPRRLRALRVMTVMRELWRRFVIRDHIFIVFWDGCAITLPSVIFHPGMQQWGSPALRVRESCRRSVIREQICRSARWFVVRLSLANIYLSSFKMVCCAFVVCEHIFIVFQDGLLCVCR